MTHLKPSVEAHAYTRFIKAFESGAFPSQRLGQAFYNTFNLHKMSNQDCLMGLYEEDGEKAKETISLVFDMH